MFEYLKYFMKSQYEGFDKNFNHHFQQIQQPIKRK